MIVKDRKTVSGEFTLDKTDGDDTIYVTFDLDGEIVTGCIVKWHEMYAELLTLLNE